MKRSPFLLIITVLSAAFFGSMPAHAHLDPVPRANFEGGFESRLTQAGPVGGYLFYHWNRPRFFSDDGYLRVIAAPTYAEAEYIHDHLPLADSALSFRIAGGMFAENFNAVSGGIHDRNRSFFGGKGEVSTTLMYPRTVFLDLLPVQGETTVTYRYRWYRDAPATASDFKRPDDGSSLIVRAGVRAGGVPPELIPDQALEASAWFEHERRFARGSFGTPERRERVSGDLGRAWLRVGGMYPVREGDVVTAFVTAGTSTNTDAIGAYRLGGGLSLDGEFPLEIHGYALTEVISSRFWLVNLAWRTPVGTPLLEARASVDLAGVESLPEYRVPHADFLAGTGVDFFLRLSERLTFGIGYGYAPWGGKLGDGGHTGRLFFEWKK